MQALRRKPVPSYSRFLIVSKLLLIQHKLASDFLYSTLHELLLHLEQQRQDISSSVGQFTI